MGCSHWGGLFEAPPNGYIHLYSSRSHNAVPTHAPKRTIRAANSLGSGVSLPELDEKQGPKRSSQGRAVVGSSGPKLPYRDRPVKLAIQVTSEM